MRIIDADQYAVEMKMRQDAVQASIEHPIADRYFTDKEHWEGVMLAFVEAKLTLDKMSTVDASPVKHGRWDDSLDGITPYCSICHMTHKCFNRTPNYCPNCGAKMDLEGLDAEKED